MTKVRKAGRKDHFRWDVFVSYSHRDEGKVKELVDRLRGKGLEVWFDKAIEPGASFPVEILRGLEHSGKQIICWSTSAKDSRWVGFELAAAMVEDPNNNPPRFVILRLDNSSLPKALTQFIYLDWEDGSDAAVAQLVQFCRTHELKGSRKKEVFLPLLPLPDRVMEIGHPLYVERIADKAIREIALSQPRSLTILAPAGLGKSSLLKRYAQTCLDSGKRVIELEFGGFERKDLVDYEVFLNRLVWLLQKNLGLSKSIEPLSKDAHYEFDERLEDLLNELPKTDIILVFDDIERLIGKEFTNDFISKLKKWTDRRAGQPPTAWTRLGFALAVSTECYLTVSSVNEMECKVGQEVELPPFDEKESMRLRQSYRATYGINLRNEDFNRIVDLLGGHPKLMRLAYGHLIGHSVEKLFAEPANPDGPFRDHLRDLESRLRSDPTGLLIASLKQIVTDGTLLNKHSDTFFKLKNAGLIVKAGARYRPANKLYAQFSFNL